jgi:hypothetical protein
VQNSIFYNSHYLVFKPSDIIFPTYTLDGENFIKKHLCELESFNKNSFESRFESKEEYLELITQNKVLIIEVNGVEKYKFIWKINKNYECLDNGQKIDCNSLLKDDFGKNYDSFKSAISLVYDDLKKKEPNISFKELKEDKSKENFFKDLFIEIDFRDNNGNLKKITKDDFGFTGDLGIFKDSENYAV